jgi:hypothetical protein
MKGQRKQQPAQTYIYCLVLIFLSLHQHIIVSVNAVSSGRWLATGKGDADYLAYSDDGGLTWTANGQQGFTVEARASAHNGGDPGKYTLDDSNNNNTYSHLFLSFFSTVYVATTHSLFSPFMSHTHHLSLSLSLCVPGRWIAVGRSTMPGTTMIYRYDNTITLSLLSLSLSLVLVLPSPYTVYV